MDTWTQLLIGFMLGVGAAGVAWRAGVLTRSGSLAAALLGGLIFGLGGLRWAALLLLFFITSSGLSHFSGWRKAALAEKFSKGTQRDWGQVAANGGLAALLVIAHTLWAGQNWIWLAFAGAMAAVNADTWATELGVLSKTAPRLITNGKVVERGTSGGVSLAGTLAALGGAAIIGLAAGWLWPQTGFWVTLLVVSLGGLTGSMFELVVGCHAASHLSLPGMPEGDRAAPAAYLWHADRSVARLALAE